MPSGGYRPGSGRKSGSKNVDHTTTKELIAQAEADGVLPLQVMFDNMRFYTREADKVLRELLDSGALAETQRDHESFRSDQARLYPTI